MLREKGERAITENRFVEAVDLFDRALSLDRNDPTLVQHYVLATYKAQRPDSVAALNNARSFLDTLSPEDSTDKKTLELFGDIEYALFEAGQGINHLVSARNTYQRLHTINSDWRSATTLMNLVVRHADHKREPIERLTDVILADHLRRQIVQFGKERLAVISELVRMEAASPKSKAEDRTHEQFKIWCAIAEAYYGLCEQENYLEARDKARRIKGGGELADLDAKFSRYSSSLASQSELKEKAGACLAKKTGKGG